MPNKETQLEMASLDNSPAENIDFIRPTNDNIAESKNSKISKKDKLAEEIRQIKNQIETISLNNNIVNVEEKIEEEILDAEFIKLQEERRQHHRELVELYFNQYTNEIKVELHKKKREILFLDGLITKFQNPKGPDRKTPIETIIVLSNQSDDMGFNIYRSKFMNTRLYDFVKNEINIITNNSDNIKGIYLTNEFNKEEKLYTGRLFIKLMKD